MGKKLVYKSIRNTRNLFLFSCFLQTNRKGNYIHPQMHIYTVADRGAEQKNFTRINIISTL